MGEVFSASGSRQAERARSPFWPLGVTAALGVLVLAASSVTVVGSDAMWLPAMGRWIRNSSSIPSGIPFAAAPSTDWVNTTVLGQLVFSLTYSLGGLGIVMTQVAAVMATFTVLAADSTKRRAKPLATAAAISAVTLGSVAPLFIARAQLLSLLPYAALLVLIRRQHDAPSTAIWWVVPLIALWSNLHGAVLVGVAVLACYLLFSRFGVTPVTAVGVGAASLLATCLNPGLLSAPSYYAGVFSSEATSDDSGMWSRLTLSNPFDVLLVLAAITLGFMAFRRRLAIWEYAAALGLAVAAVTAARHGIWLLLFLAVPAAVGRGRGVEYGSLEPRSRRSRHLPVMVSLACVVAAGAVLAARAPSFRSADAQAAEVASATRGQVVLATEPLAESLAAAGATVWVANPLDAFAQPDQAAFLAFMKGDARGSLRALVAADVVVALPGSAQARVAAEAGMKQTALVSGYSILAHQPKAPAATPLSTRQ